MRAYETECISSSYKPCIKETMFNNCLLLYINQKEKTNKSNKRVKSERGRREMFFFFFFFGCSKHQSQGIQPHSIYSIKVIQTVTYRISTDQIAIKDGCCCGGR